MLRPRAALALAPCLALALALPSSAAPTSVPQVKDAKGDAVTQQADSDIVSVLYTTAGKGSGRAYAAKQLKVVLTLAAPPSTRPGLNYEVESFTDACSDVAFTYSPGTPYGDVTGITGWVDWGSCTVGDSGAELITPKVSGNTITWQFSIKATPFDIGDEFSDFRARVDPANPVLPLQSSSQTGERGLVDSATGKATWVLR